MRRAAVLGQPIAHSLSPVLHRAAHAELGLDWSYDAIECDEQRLPHLLDALDDCWAGLSLTMPLKRAVLPLLDDVCAEASAVGGANTVVFTGGTRRGANTDIGGMVDALRERGVAGVRAPVILGAGATACAALAAAQCLGARGCTVAVRDPSRTATVRDVARRLDVPLHVRTLAQLPALLPPDLLVSTLPSGAADAVAGLMDGAARGHAGAAAGPEAGADSPPHSGAAVLDVCYDPWRSHGS